MSSPSNGEGGGGEGGGETTAIPSNATDPSPTATQMNLQLTEVTQMLQERTAELSALRQEHASLKATSDAHASRVASLEAQVSPSGSEGSSGASAALAAKDEELSTLRSKTNDMILKIERLESENVTMRIMAERSVAKIEAVRANPGAKQSKDDDAIQQEKDDEIVALKEMFTQVSEKRKESFLQLKERLRTASEMLSKNQEQHAADARTIAQLQSQLDESQRALKEREAQVEDYVSRVHALENEKGDLFQRTSNELHAAKAAVREGHSKLETMSAELARVSAAAQLAEMKEQRQASTEMSVESDSNICENGRPVRIVAPSLPADTPTQWYRSFRGSAFQPIPGQLLSTGASYTPTVDDIGAVLKAELLVGPDRNIGVSREFGPIGSKRAMVLAIHEHIKSRDVTFNVASAYDTTADVKNRPQILLNHEKIKLRVGGKTVAKAGYSDHLRVTLDTESLTRFTVRLDGSSNPLSYATSNAQERDLIVQTIRSFNQAMMIAAVKSHPPDAVLALAYLIRTANESRNIAMIKAGASSGGAAAGAGGAPAVIRATSTSTVGGGSGVGARPRQHSDADDWGFQATTGAHPDTPNATAYASGAARGALADTPRSTAGASSSSSAAPATAAYAAAAASSSTSSAPFNPAPAKSAEPTPVAVGKIKGSNGEDLEIDADGFVIRRDTGWAEEKKPARSSAEAAGDDSDFSGGEDELNDKPAFQMKINTEARPRASGADLRKSISEFGLGPPGAHAKGKKEKKDKEKKQHKKKNKLSVTGEEGDAHDPDQSPASGHTEAPGGPAPSPPNNQPSASASASSINNADDLFAFFDTESQSKAPPPLGVSPSPASSPAAAAASAAAGSSGSSSAVVPSTPGKAPVISPRPEPSPSSPARLAATSDNNFVDVLVMETLHARMVAGEVVEYAVWGEVLLNLAAPNPRGPVRFEFQMFNTDSMGKVAPNSALLSASPGGQPNSWVATIPTNTDAPLCVLKYKVNTDLEQARRQVPLQLQVRWQCSKQNTVLDVDYKLTQDSHTPLLDVKFLVAMAPEKSIKQCTLAVPKCMWSPQSQKMMWQLANLPNLDTAATSGQLHAELVNQDVACTPSPLSVSFMSDDLDSVLSGVLVTEADSKKADTLPLGRLIYRVKSGIFTVM